MTAGYNGKIRENPGEKGRVDRYGYGKDCTSVLYGLHNQIIAYSFSILIHSFNSRHFRLSDTGKTVPRFSFIRIT